MRLWLIDAGYLFNAARSVEHNFQFDYLKLRNKVEETTYLWRTYYLNSTPHTHRQMRRTASILGFVQLLPAGLNSLPNFTN